MARASNRLPASGPEGGGSLAHGIRLLLALAGRGSGGARVAELAAELGLDRSTIYRLAGVLRAFGLLRSGDNLGVLELGPGVLTLSDAFVSGLDLARVADGVIESLARSSGETVHLAVVDGVEMVYVKKIESSHPVRLVSRVGTRVPMHSTALGKAVLAASGWPEATSREALVGILSRRTKSTLTDEGQLAADVRKIRDRGYAIDWEENEVGVVCVGSACRDRSGWPVGAVSVSSPVHRADGAAVARNGERVAEAARTISRELGWEGV